MKNKGRIILICVITLICLLVAYFATSVAVRIFTSLKNYDERIARQSDYTKITTPLPNDVVEDICLKFEIKSDDPRCLPGSVAYGPDFFPDIKEMLRHLPREEATYQTVQDKLGNYLLMCEQPDNEGYYACRYDLRGDEIYPILIFFTEANTIYQVFADTSGS